jgi:hypothetical protein
MNPMITEKLKHSYREQLIKAGVEPQRAMQAARKITPDELRIIGEIWEEWGHVARGVEVDAIDDKVRPIFSPAVELKDAS